MILPLYSGPKSKFIQKFQKKYYFDNKKFYADLGLLTSPYPQDRSNAHQNWIASLFQKVPQNYPCKISAPPGPYFLNGQWPNVCRCTKKPVFKNSKNKCDHAQFVLCSSNREKVSKKFCGSFNLNGS